MNYPESQEILEEIKKANNILLNCHVNPDPDSIGSSLALKNVLESMGKKIEVVCPSENLFENVDYLKGYKEIKKASDLSKFDFSKFDLFITLDSSDWRRVTGDIDVNLPKDIKIIDIDHHHTNQGYGAIDLIGKTANSVAEMLFSIFKDWEIKIDKDTADCLMAGIVGDTGAFRFPNVKKEVFLATAELMDLGANKDYTIERIYRNEPFNLMKFYGEVLSNLKFDKEGKFVYSTVSFETYSKFKKPHMAKESAASLFSQVVEDSDFGFVAVEQEKGKLSVSFRSRTGFDISRIAIELGGGGHIYAAGAKITGLEFDDAVKKLLDTVRRVVDEQTKV